MQAATESWVRLNEAGARADLSEQSIRLRIRDGRLRAKRVGGKLWVSVTSLEEMLRGEDATIRLNPGKGQEVTQ